jgi:hypothetical protein
MSNPAWCKRSLAILVLLAGCGKSGPELAAVSGRVTLDGQPLPGAQLMFQPEALGSPSFGLADREGKYELGYKRGVKGAVIGWHAVKIQMDPGASTPSGEKSLPARYNTESNLRREVVSGENILDFELTSEK